jgi:hypothetical protein
MYSHRLAQFAFALSVLAPSAGAQNATGPAHPIDRPIFIVARLETPASNCCGSSMTMSEVARLDNMVAAADEMFAAGRLPGARRMLKNVAAEQSGGGLYPAATLRRLANVEYALNRESAAAATLEELAATAHKFNDPGTELTALVDASLLYLDLGRRDKQRELVTAIRPLLQSPSIPVETRTYIARLLNLR